jgi:hypothetical protein
MESQMKTEWGRFPTCPPLITCLLCIATTVPALDLHNASIQADPNLTAHEKKAVQMLIEEVEHRTALNWPQAPGTGPIIKIHHATNKTPAEGFHLTVHGETVDIQGNDERGTLFGVGRFLRALRWDHFQASIDDNLDITTSPKYALRGHQIGYRPKVNTYDAWTPAIFEQYLRDMVIFGTNAVELIPPRSDDDDDSPHFHLSKIDMMAEMSRICADYGIDVWIWYPAMDKDYSDPKTVESALKEWSEVYKKLPRIDAIFVPGGDPGHTQPKYMFALLEKQKQELRKYHPKGQMWMSPQNFDAAWFQEFLGLMQNEPKWLDGVVYGPWTRVTIQELRAKIRAHYPIRYYPDITHTIHAEFPVPEWDVAFAVTEARESINPRPTDYKKIFHHMMPSANLGFLTYSEGVNDDMNKFVWSGLGWDPDQDVGQILREWARWFISPAHETALAQAVLDLEQDWHGPLLPRPSVDDTLRKVQSIERAATPQMLLTWRFQQILYRAYYDSFVRQRLVYETGLEQQALDRLREAPRTGSTVAVDEATRILDDSQTNPAAEDLRNRIFALAEALYQSIHMQLSVDRYKGIAISRGANLDTIDFPLNNRVWLKDQFAKLRALPKEDDRLVATDAILHRTDPGPGGFYDDLGSTAMQPHLVNEGPGYADDPGSFHSVRSEYAAFSGGLIGRTSADATRPDGPANFILNPMAWWTWAETRYETPFTMRYEHLDPHASYKVSVVFVGRSSDPKIKLIANEKFTVHDWIQKPNTMQPVEFPIPAEATRSGTLTLRWFLDQGQGGFNGSIDIAEVFLKVIR